MYALTAAPSERKQPHTQTIIFKKHHEHRKNKNVQANTTQN